MESGAFDRLTRLIAGAASRRGALAGLAAVVAGFLGSADAGAQGRCRPLGRRCLPDRGLDCCPGTTCQDGRCGCPGGKTRCGNRCIPARRCCRDKCSGGAICRNDRCVCPKGRKRCHGRCVPKSVCCRDRECGPGEACQRGRCRCRAGFKPCNGGCIRDAACCGGCPAEHVCRAGSCCRIGTTAALQAALGPEGPDTIRLCPNTTYSGTFSISRDVTLVGAGAASSVLNGGGSGPVVTVGQDVTATLQALRVTGGSAGEGGGIAVPFRAMLTLVDVEVTGNTSTGLGAGILVRNATLLLAGASRVAVNQNPNAGGGIYSYSSTVTLTETSVVTSNQAEEGGGIYATSGSTVILRNQSQFDANQASQIGGGIYIDNGRLELQDQSAITGNRARQTPGDSGGGIFRLGGSSVDIGPQATVSGNTPDNCEPTIGTCT